MFGRGEIINPRAVIETTMDRTLSPASRSADGDIEKIGRAAGALGTPVVIEKFVPGIMYQYYMRPARLTDYKKLLKNDSVFAAAFGTSNVRLCAVGEHIVLEVPGAESTVHTADILLCNEYLNTSGLKVAIGKRMDRGNVLADIEAMPHMLIAGTTGSGKSVFMHQLIISLLINHRRRDLQLYLIDPKMVEMQLYKPLKNCQVVTDTGSAIALLNGLCAEMDRRYQMLSASRCRDIDSYNATAWNPMIRKVVFIDELADLILTGKKAVEGSIVRLAQKARACGIHLVIATQRPDRTVVTGLIKTNIPVKACLSVNTSTDSRIVLDRSGGEKLVGKGDMLYLGAGMIEPIRCQSGFISEREIKNVVRALSRR